MHNFRVGDIVWLALYTDREDRSLLRIIGINWTERDNSVIFNCELLKDEDLREIIIQKITIKASLMKEAVMAEENIQLLYGYREANE